MLQADAPAAEKAPGGHCAQVALEAAPVAALAVPAVQGVAVTEEKGQYAPAGHREGVPEEQ